MAERRRVEQDKIKKNKRERDRVEQLRKHFEDLRVRLPDKNKITTKAEILISAKEYIDFLEDIVEQTKMKKTEESRTENRPSCRYSKGPAVSYLQPNHTAPLPPLADQLEFTQTRQEMHFENGEWMAQLGDWG